MAVGVRRGKDRSGRLENRYASTWAVGRRAPGIRPPGVLGPRHMDHGQLGARRAGCSRHRDALPGLRRNRGYNVGPGHCIRPCPRSVAAWRISILFPTDVAAILTGV